MSKSWSIPIAFSVALLLTFGALHALMRMSFDAVLPGILASDPWVGPFILAPELIAACFTLMAGVIALSIDKRASWALGLTILIVTGIALYQIWLYSSWFSQWPHLARPSLSLLVAVLFIGGGVRQLMRSTPASSDGNDRRVKNGVFGDSAFATIKQMQARFPSDGEVVIGEAYTPKIGGELGEKPAGNAPLLTDPLTEGSTHGLLIAGSGGYKTTSVIIPTLCACGHSCVVFDPKKELAKAARRVRETHGKEVHILDPSSAEVSGFNALDWVDMQAPTATQDLFEVANWIIGESLQQSNSPNQFFQEAAKNLIHTFLIDLMSDPDLPDDQRTLATLGIRLGKTEKSVRGELDEIASYCEHPTAKRLAASLAELDSRTFASVHTTATTSAAWLMIDNLVGVVSSSDFTTADIREQRADLFIQTELQTLTTHPGLGRVVLGALFLPMFRHNPVPNSRVVFLLDEVARLGHMPILETARDVGRSAGITLILMYQSHGQFSDQWGREGTNKWFENVAWRAYGAVGDHSTAEIISRSIGDYTVLSEGQSQSAGSSTRRMELLGSSSSNRGQSASEQKRRLINPDEILSKVPADAQFVFVAGMPPIFAGRAIYFRRQDISQWID